MTPWRLQFSSAPAGALPKTQRCQRCSLAVGSATVAMTQCGMYIQVRLHQPLHVGSLQWRCLASQTVMLLLYLQSGCSAYL